MSLDGMPPNLIFDPSVITYYGRGSIGAPGVCEIRRRRYERPTDISEIALQRKIGSALTNEQARTTLDNLLQKGSLPLRTMTGYQSVVAVGQLSAAWLVDVDPERIRLTELGAEVAQRYFTKP